MEKRKIITLRLPCELNKKLSAKAKKIGISKNALLTWTLSDSLGMEDQNEKKRM